MPQERTNVTVTTNIDEVKAIGIEAYIFLYPLITMEVTRQQMTNVAPNTVPLKGPMNTFVHVPAYPAADMRMVVRPNFDTLYSSAWIDVSKEPMILSAPDTGDRYYMLPMLDMWTDVFAVPGTRTSGNGAGHFGIVNEDWHGELPPGVERIEAPTDTVWIIGRTQTNGPADYDAVHAIQAGFTLTPLSRWGKDPLPPEVKIDPDVDMVTEPLKIVNGMSGVDFFTRAAELMKIHPPHLTDWSTVARLRRIGIRAGESFDANALTADVRAALNAAPEAAQGAMARKLPTMATVVNGWSMNTDSMGVYGDFYMKRAIVTLVGLGANQAVDAIYPLNVADADGKPVDGSNKYVMHFTKDELPPADAFWSLTMYDAEGFQVANELNRFAIGDRDALQYNADGSLDLYIQHESPGADKESNWLPAGPGPLGLTMRLYAPRVSVLDGSWAPPPVRKV